jgi:excisionase family DNA binding protein
MSTLENRSQQLSFSPSEAAAYIGLSVRSLYRLLETGVISGRRCGGRTLVDGQSLRAHYVGLPLYKSRRMPNAPPRAKRRARS